MNQWLNYKLIIFTFYITIRILNSYYDNKYKIDIYKIILLIY